MMSGGSIRRRLELLEAQIPATKVATEEELREEAWGALVRLLERAQDLGKRLASCDSPEAERLGLDSESTMDLVARLVVPTQDVPDERVREALERRVLRHEERGEHESAGLLRLILAVWQQVKEPAEGEDHHEVLKQEEGQARQACMTVKGQ